MDIENFKARFLDLIEEARSDGVPLEDLQQVVMERADILHELSKEERQDDSSD